MNLFIDTNIFLNFYHYSEDDLEELKKLVVVLEQKKASLLLPEQVVDELRRNREAKIAQGLKSLREQTLALRFPEFCKHFQEFPQLRSLQKEYSNLHGELLQAVMKGIEKEDLLADHTIKALFQEARELPISPEVVERARTRGDRGNPPGKSGSLGDAIIWELLLEHAPASEDLHFISDDRDFSSPLNPAALDGFLAAEWESAKASQVLFYKTVSALFRQHFPEITLASEAEKDLLIRDLANSGSFARTHATVAKLRGFSEFTTDQASAIVDAALSNSQVGWILGDPDVRALLTSVVVSREKDLDPEKIRKLREPLGLGSTREEDDVPF
jgi:hypothetical protein